MLPCMASHSPPPPRLYCQARPDDASARCGCRAGALPPARRPTDGHCVEAGDAQCWRPRRRRRSVVDWRHTAGRHVRRPRPRRCGHGREAYPSRRRDGRGVHRWRGCGRCKHPERAAPARLSLALATAVADGGRQIRGGPSPLTVLSRHGREAAHLWRRGGGRAAGVGSMARRGAG